MNESCPAFPQQSGFGSDGTYKFDTVGGMSLRDYFAAHAPKMTELWAADMKSLGVSPLEAEARWRYEFANVMLVFRSKQ